VEAFFQQQQKKVDFLIQLVPWDFLSLLTLEFTILGGHPRKKEFKPQVLRLRIGFKGRSGTSILGQCESTSGLGSGFSSGSASGSRDLITKTVKFLSM
jgi:hypothetical protein